MHTDSHFSDRAPDARSLALELFWVIENSWIELFILHYGRILEEQPVCLVPRLYTRITGFIQVALLASSTPVSGIDCCFEPGPFCWEVSASPRNAMCSQLGVGGPAPPRSKCLLENFFVTVEHA